jgi:pimeloyl-ACP methyl ester carboxylesterase
LVGHDWGAAVAWATASFAPEPVDHLVALSVGHLSSFSKAGMIQREKSW